MELNNFEKQALQKLSNREIKPSENSWDRLDAMLSVEVKPKKKGFFWINIAASFIVFASIGYYFYNQNEVMTPVEEETIIVEVEDKNIENGEENLETRYEKQDEVLVENEIKSEKSNQVVNQKFVNNSTISNQESIIINQGVSTINQSKDNPIVLNSENNIQKPMNTNKYISAEKLLAEVSNKKFESKKTEKDFRRNVKGVSVNPNALLSNAETEIYQSFRENALERLNKNYNTIKTALVNRNYEDEL